MKNRMNKLTAGIVVFFIMIKDNIVNGNFLEGKMLNPDASMNCCSPSREFMINEICKDIIMNIVYLIIPTVLIICLNILYRSKQTKKKDRVIGICNRLLLIIFFLLCFDGILRVISLSNYNKVLSFVFLLLYIFVTIFVLTYINKNKQIVSEEDKKIINTIVTMIFLLTLLPSIIYKYSPIEMYFSDMLNLYIIIITLIATYIYYRKSKQTKKIKIIISIILILIILGVILLING